MEEIKVNVHDAKSRFDELLDRVETCEEIVITKSGSPVVARLIPIQTLHTLSERRVRGTAKGKIRIGADFDAPLPKGMFPESES